MYSITGIFIFTLLIQCIGCAPMSNDPLQQSIDIWVAGELVRTIDAGTSFNTECDMVSIWKTCNSTWETLAECTDGCFNNVKLETLSAEPPINTKDSMLSLYALVDDEKSTVLGIATDTDFLEAAKIRLLGTEEYQSIELSAGNDHLSIVPVDSEFTLNYSPDPDLVNEI